MVLNFCSIDTVGGYFYVKLEPYVFLSPSLGRGTFWLAVKIEWATSAE